MFQRDELRFHQKHGEATQKETGLPHTDTETWWAFILQRLRATFSAIFITMHITSREHKRNPSMQQNQAEKETQQREMCYGLSKQDSVRGEKKRHRSTTLWCGRWRSHTKLWGGVGDSN